MEISKPRKMVDKFAKISNRPYTVILSVAVISAFMAYGATQISMSTEMHKFLPKEYVSVKVSEELENKIGGFTSEQVLIKGDDLTTADSFKSIAEFDNKLVNYPPLKDYIIQVKSYPDYLPENLILLPDNEIEKRIQGFFLQLKHSDNKQIEQLRQKIGSLLSENRNAALVRIRVNARLSEAELNDRTKTLHKVTQNFDGEHPNLAAKNAGELTMRQDMSSQMNRDNQILIPAAIIAVIFILFLTFRRLSDTGLPFLVLGVSAFWTVGSMGLLGIPFTMIFVALVPILLGVGMAYTIHMLNRYYEERGEGLDASTSAARSVGTTGGAVTLTAVTTMIGFGSFYISDMPPIRDFGLFAALGIFFTFILTTTLLPSLLILRDRGGEREKKRKKKKGGGMVESALSRVASGTERYGKPIIIGGGIVAALCIIPAFGLTTTMSFEQFLPEGVESVATMHEIEDYFGARGDYLYVLTEGDVTSPESLQSMYSLENSVKADPKNKQLITDSTSLADLVMYSAGGQIPENSAQIEMILNGLKNEQPKKIQRLLLENDKAVIYFSVQARTDKEMEEATEIIRSHVRDVAQGSDKLDFTVDGEPAVGGTPAIMTDVMKSIVPNMQRSIVLAIVLVGVVLAIVYRSALIGLIASIPIYLAILWEFGALGGLGWSLDVMNMMVSALAIGIGIDFAIHVTHRFREEWKEKGMSPEKSLLTTVRRVGRALMAAAATTIGVFLILALSRMPPITRFGTISGLIIFFALIGALLVLPPVLLSYTRWKER